MVEKAYTLEKARRYDQNISYLADIFYIYDRIPFISGIKSIYISKNNKIPSSEDYITKEEIENYMKEFNMKMNDNSAFRLNDIRTWKV